MASSFSQELEDLLNPLPKFADPEDDGDEATKARVIERFDEDDGVGLSSLRRRAPLPSRDARYRGQPVSRTQLTMETETYTDEDEEGGEDRYSEVDETEDPVESEEIDIAFPQQLDFQKVTEGLDELGVSEGEQDTGEGEQDTSEGEQDTGEGEQDTGEESDDSEEEDGQDGLTICTLSQNKVDEEVEKGKAVKNQLSLWDQLLEGRIKIQKALVLANQLPQPQTFPDFQRRGGAELPGALKTTHKAVKALQRSLLELHGQLLLQNPDTRGVPEGKLQAHKGDEMVTSDDDDDEEDMRAAQDSGATKRKVDMAEYPVVMAKRFAAFDPYCSTVLQKWDDKTKLTIGKSSKGFGAFERNILSQVEQVLVDRERLVRRTQTRRSEYSVLGKKELSSVLAVGEVEGQQLKANMHLKDVDKDIFDDDDFYHQLLRELIERKTSATNSNNQVAMGRQWLAIQKLRSKIKKKVDTKASKGRKVRFHIHSKLVNYMAPMDYSSVSDEARDELYRSLFGSQSSSHAK
ncbi:protein AATF [Cololabis saira]|uniref:protein AATF n=1 Tax=Cololabis saira TaxID=129043 RepID=UPI002AD3498A|nr:protein AATF [Cololabis saira]